MPGTKEPKQHSRARRKPQAAVVNGSPGDVLTLAEAAAYLRFGEADVLRLVDEQGLPARRLALEWRFFKPAIAHWLSTLPPKGNKDGIWGAAGSLKDDPCLDEMLKAIEHLRGRPMPEED
jgi:hypothetical protein